MREEFGVGDVRCAGDGGEDDEVGGAQQVVRGVVDGDGGPFATLLQVDAELARVLGAQVVDAHVLELPAGGGQEGVDVAGDESGAHDAEPQRPGRPWESRSAASAADAAVRTALMMEPSMQANG